MSYRSAFSIDCTPIIPECKFKCPKCIEEMESIFCKMQGVNKLYTEQKGQETAVIVEYEPSIVSVEQLLKTFKDLPSFYKGFFIPEVLET